MTKKSENDTPSGQPDSRRATYRDIAKALGVSKMTVSYSLRNDPRIPEATRQRVQKKAAEMNYRPDPLLSALSAYRHDAHPQGNQAALAWINFYRQPEKLREQKVFDLYWKGAFDAARQLGFKLEEFRFRDLTLKRMHSIFKARGIRGILLAPTPPHEEPSSDDLEAFPWNDYALVRFGESLRTLKGNVISSAQVTNTILAFEQMQKKGYERIGFAGHYLRHRLFSAGYLWAQQALPPARQLPPLFLPAGETARYKPMLTRWLEEHKPDAIICGALHLLETLEKLGIRIPDELGLASMGKYDNPVNAGIDQNPEEIGRTAIHTLTSQLNENRYGTPASPKEILVEGRWVDGSMLPDRNLTNRG